MPVAIVGPLLLVLVGVGGGGYAVYRWFRDKERERPELARGGGGGDGVDAAFRGALRASPEEIVKATEREQAAAKERGIPAQPATPTTPPTPTAQPGTKPVDRTLQYESRPRKTIKNRAASRFEEAARRAAESAQAPTTTSGASTPRKAKPARGRRP